MSRVTKQKIIDEIIRCGKDPIYFINKYAYIQHPVKGKIKFNTYSYQDDVVSAFLNNRFNVVLKARQLGLSTITAAYCAWLILLHRDKNVLVVATKQDVAKNMIRAIRNIFKYLPKWIKDVAPMVVDNRHSIELENGSRVKAVATSGDVGRSEAVSFLVVDEAAHIPGFEEIWVGLWPTLSCLTGDTRVITNKGIKKIKDFCKDKRVGEYFEIDGLKTIGLNGSLERVSHGYVSPESETLKIKTKKGLEVEVTQKHPLYKLCFSGGEMTKAKNLKIGDFLRIDVGMNCWGSQSITQSLFGDKLVSSDAIVNQHFAYMLGGFIAEGWITNNNSLIEISNQDDDFRDVFINNKIIKGFVPKNDDKCRLRCSSVELVNLFIEAGVVPEWKCDTKRVPEGIWSAPKNVVAKFLQAYFDGDGSVTTRGIIGSSTSEKLLQDIQQLLLNFGIISSIAKVSIDKEKQYGRTMPSGQKLSSLKDSYNLTIARSFFKKFAEEIGFNIQRKQNQLLKLVDLYVDDTRKQFRIPLSEVREKVVEILVTTRKTQKWFRENGLRVDRIKDGKDLNNIWFKRLKNLIIENDLFVGDDRNMEFLTEMTNSCFWDEIVSITPSKNKTYDFTVPGTHAFLQNGIMGSNTGGSAALLSTPNGAAGAFYDIWHKAKNKENNFNCTLGNYVRPDDPSEKYNDRLMWWVHPDHDVSWFEKETKGRSAREVSQEYLCNFLASGDTFLDPDTLMKMQKYVRDPIKTFHSNDGVWIWEEADKEGQYLIAADVSRGDSEDYSAFHVVRLDVEPLEQVAEYKGKIRPDQLGLLLMDVSKYYNGAIIAPENNSGWAGQTILKIEEARYPHLYYSKRKKPKEKDHYYQANSYYAMDRNDYLPGYAVTVVNRNSMLAKVEEYIRLGYIKVNSIRTLEEFETFIVKLTESGEKPIAQRGRHDDLIMALAGLLWVREESFKFVHKSDEVAMAMLMGMSTTNTPSGVPVQDSRIKPYYNRDQFERQAKSGYQMTLSNGEEIDLSWLISSG